MEAGNETLLQREVPPLCVAVERRMQRMVTALTHFGAFFVGALFGMVLMAVMVVGKGK